VRAVPPGQQQSKALIATQLAHVRSGPGAEHMQIPTPTTWYTRLPLESGPLGWWAPAGEHTDPRAGTCAGAAVALRASGVWAVVAASRGCILHSAALRAHRHDRTSRVFYTDRWGQTGRVRYRFTGPICSEIGGIRISNKRPRCKRFQPV
jgi:hypothetical protein